MVSLELMNQNLPFNDLMLKVGKIHISVPLNRTSNCQHTNFTFDTSFHNKSGYKQKNVQSQKRHRALPPDCHWQELVLYLMEVLDLHSILILRTPVLIGLNNVYNRLVLFLHYKLDSNHASLQHAAKVPNCVCTELQSCTFISFIADPL